MGSTYLEGARWWLCAACPTSPECLCSVNAQGNKEPQPGSCSHKQKGPQRGRSCPALSPGTASPTPGTVPKPFLFTQPSLVTKSHGRQAKSSAPSPAQLPGTDTSRCCAEGPKPPGDEEGAGPSPGGLGRTQECHPRAAAHAGCPRDTAAPLAAEGTGRAPRCGVRGWV